MEQLDEQRLFKAVGTAGDAAGVAARKPDEEARTGGASLDDEGLPLILRDLQKTSNRRRDDHVA